MADEAPVLQQYSKQLNVYNADESDRGRLVVNYADAFEISYRTGLGSVLIRNLSYQTGDLPEDIHNINNEMYNIREGRHQPRHSRAGQRSYSGCCRD